MGAQLPLLGGPPDGSWTALDERKRGTRFLATRARSVINNPDATHMPFWSLNPYIGCEFGCTYCYARDTHRWAAERGGGMDRSESPSEAFERNILVKENAAAVLLRSLDPARLAGTSLVIGTATDPYQPAERKFRVTRAVLETLMLHRDLSLGIITKSPLIVRDIDLLAALATRHQLRINISLATTDAKLARRLEARSPVPTARLRALGKLRDAGLDAGVIIAPILPGITDSFASLNAVFAAARGMDATFVIGAPLRLGPAARRTFLPHLAHEFPELVARYERHFALRQRPTPEYRDRLSARLRKLRERHGFADSSMAARDDVTVLSSGAGAAPLTQLELPTLR